MVIDNSISVIIAAWNAQTTIGRAIRSALSQPETTEVVLVDDCSTDATIIQAKSADDGTGRLRILTQPSNGGPAAARNRAIAESQGAIIAILDADDFLLPGRFAFLLGIRDWDMIADNIVFIPEKGLDAFREDALRSFPARVDRVDLVAFVEANISRRVNKNKELGFAKPLIRRNALSRLGNCYDENIRLGEDYILYARLLAAGAVFLTTNHCGYAAVERRSSLSGHHTTADLAYLLAGDHGLLAFPGLGSTERAAVRRHIDQLTGKLWHRQVLDERQRLGIMRGMRMALTSPGRLPSLISAFAYDKLTAFTSRTSSEQHYLLP